MADTKPEPPQYGKAGGKVAWLATVRFTLWREVIALGAVLMLLGALAGYGYYHWSINRPLDFGERVWAIQQGETLHHIATRLEAENVIGDTLPLKVLARINGLHRQIHAGEYRFPPRISLKEFLQLIASGQGRVENKVTIIEGWTFRQMRAQLREAPKLRHTTVFLSDQAIMAKLGHPDWHPEGRFFPDTYHYDVGETDLSIYRRAFRLMQKKLDHAWENRADNLVLQNRYEALVLASIIEKETYAASEGSKISSVFHNRLRRGMRLQTDPTVIYGLGAAYRGQITRTHLKTDTPYNTYTRGGLTPTPISLPGAESLQAAVRPLKTNVYYFVAKGGGRHHFSRTLREHNRAVRKYLRNRKKK